MGSQQEDVETLTWLIDNYTEEEFLAEGLSFTWKTVELLVNRVRELETQIALTEAYEAEFGNSW